MPLSSVESVRILGEECTILFMIESYEGALLVTPSGILQTPLVIDTRRGRILPATAARHAKKRIDASQWALYPGLINAHDHLEFNHYPRTRWRECYPNASQWAADFDPHLAEEPFRGLRALPLRERCMIGAWKNLASGVTTVAHHNPPHKLLWARDFPLRVLRRYTWAHSLYLTPPRTLQEAWRRAWRGVFMLHLAEGTDAAAAAELDALEKLGGLSHKTVLIHGVGIVDVEKAVEKSAGLVWCPSSNLFLLGQTAQVGAWFAAGKLALGSDSRLTADGDLLDELRAAHQTGQLSPRQLFHLVTDYAARLLRLSDVGDLRPTMRADVLALPRADDPYLALVNARRADVAWVLRDGRRVFLPSHFG